MFLVNTEKGQKWFDTVSKNLYFQTIDKEILYENNRFSDEIVIPKEQPEFINSVANESFETTVKRFLSPKKDWGKLIYYKSPRFLRELAIKLLRG